MKLNKEILFALTFVCFFSIGNSQTINSPISIASTKSDEKEATPAKDSMIIQPVHHASGAPPVLDVFTNLPADWAEWAKREFRAERIPIYLGVGAATVAMVVYDEPAIQPFKKEYKKPGIIHTWFDISEFTGEGWFQFGIAGAFAAHGFLTDDSKSLSTAVQTTEVIFACGGVVQLLKHLTGRESPCLESEPRGRWRLFPNPIAYQKRVPMYDAFPSGHVATATATLTVIMENYPDEHWIPYVGIPLITSLAVAMMGQEIHWISDYPLAVVLGYSFGKVVADLHKGHVSQDTSENSKLIPEAEITFLQGFTPGLSLTWRF